MILAYNELSTYVIRYKEMDNSIVLFLLNCLKNKLKSLFDVSRSLNEQVDQLQSVALATKDEFIQKCSSDNDFRALWSLCYNLKESSGLVSFNAEDFYRLVSSGEALGSIPRFDSNKQDFVSLLESFSQSISTFSSMVEGLETSIEKGDRLYSSFKKLIHSVRDASSDVSNLLRFAKSESKEQVFRRAIDLCFLEMEGRKVPRDMGATSREKSSSESRPFSSKTAGSDEYRTVRFTRQDSSSRSESYRKRLDSENYKSVSKDTGAISREKLRSEGRLSSSRTADSDKCRTASLTRQDSSSRSKSYRKRLDSENHKSVSKDTGAISREKLSSEGRPSSSRTADSDKYRTASLTRQDSSSRSESYRERLGSENCKAVSNGVGAISEEKPSSESKSSSSRAADSDEHGTVLFTRQDSSSGNESRGKVRNKRCESFSDVGKPYDRVGGRSGRQGFADRDHFSVYQPPLYFNRPPALHPFFRPFHPFPNRFRPPFQGFPFPMSRHQFLPSYHSMPNLSRRPNVFPTSPPVSDIVHGSTSFLYGSSSCSRNVSPLASSTTSISNIDSDENVSPVASVSNVDSISSLSDNVPSGMLQDAQCCQESKKDLAR